MCATVTIDADFDRQIHNKNNDNDRNGSCLTWLATVPLKGEAQMAYTIASSRGQCSK